MDHSVSFVKRIPAIVAAIVIVFAPLVISKVVTYEYNNPKLFAIEIGLAIVIALVLFTHSFASWKKIIRQPVSWGIKLFLITTLLATLASMDSTISWFGNIDRGTGMFFFIVVATAACALGVAVRKEDAKKYSLVPMAISGVLVGLSVDAELWGWKVLSTAGHGGFIGNTSITASYLMITFFVAGYLLWSAQSVRVKWAYGIAMAAMVLNVVFVNFSFFSGVDKSLFALIGEAKGAALSILFGAIIALAVWLITSAKKSKKVIGSVLLAVSLLSATIGIVGLVLPNNPVHNWFVQKETEVRFIYWNTSIEAFKAHPLLGTGPETYAYTYQHYFDPIVMVPGHSGEIWSDKPHNAYLEVLTEKGIVGVLGYLALFVGIIVSFTRLYRANGDRKLLIVMSGLFAAYLLNNLILFDTVTSYFLIFMLLAFFMADQKFEYPQTLSSVGEKTLRIILGLAIVTTVTAIVIPQLLKTHRSTMEFTLALDRRASYYQYTENTSSFGSSLFISQRADFSYQSIFEPNLGLILQQNEGNRKIAATAIQGLIDTLKDSFSRYPENSQGMLAMGKLASIKMVILNTPDADSLATMKFAAEQATIISPNNPNGYLLLGQEYVYEQKYDDAFVQFENARALQPTIVMPHMSLINLANLIGDRKRAQFYADRARQQSPDFAALAK